MNLEKLEKKIQLLITNLSKETFVFDLLLAYGQPKASITRLQKGDYNLSKDSGEILWKKKLFFKEEALSDLHILIDKLKNDPAITKHHPRFIIITDYQTLLSIDTKTDDTLDIPFSDLAKHFDFFLPWMGMEKAQFQSENPADIKAAERMGRLYDRILEDNPIRSEEDRHALNTFFSRLLFCFFAEDTGIFADNQFTNGIASHTAEDGRDLQTYLQKLFTVLNLPKRSEYPQFLQDFPYVNGGLFATASPVPVFDINTRRIIVESGALNWKSINPDIFGSMIQTVVHSDLRDNMGMHYTSVVNIMKVIEPLFLDDLYFDLEKAGESKIKLTALLKRLQHLRIFDPACGSGNFLIIVYKELCKLEIEILKRLHGDQLAFQFTDSNIKLSQFYGIELDDFAHETTKLSLYLAEHQMNLAFKEVFGVTRPTLPLQDGGNIVCGNATRLDWEDVCPKDDGAEIYILGNPPFSGSRKQDKNQKNDMKFVFISRYKSLDYVASWFYLASSYIENTNFKYAFVSTNSIVQGEQVSLLWPRVLREKLEIGFAHKSFKWTNNAKGNAGVMVIIVGVRNIAGKKKRLYSHNSFQVVDNINGYLAAASTIYIHRHSKPFFNDISPMVYGSLLNDGGNLVLSTAEKDELVSRYPESQKMIKRYIGSREFLRGTERWSLYISDNDLEIALNIPEIKRRLEAVTEKRSKSTEKSTVALAQKPHHYYFSAHKDGDSIFVPRTSAERRRYVPIGLLQDDTIISDAQAIYNPELYLFAIISSRFHMVWVRAVAGRLKTDLRYSSALCYNTFPFPQINGELKETLESHVFKVLDERERHPEKTLAQLYDPDKMPESLRLVHHEMDLAVEQCYRRQPFNSDEERLEYLFTLYEEMIEAEKREEKQPCLI
jgi:hypothetical protein